jgi:hypothetical protein
VPSEPRRDRDGAGSRSITLPTTEPAEREGEKVFEVLGRITAAWGEAEILWELIFSCLLYETDRRKSDAILQQFQTFAAKRHLIIAVGQAAFSPRSFERLEIGRLQASTNDVSGLRNAVVHAWYVMDPLNAKIGVRIAPGTGAKPNRLAGKPLEVAMPDILRQIESLVEQLDAFRLHLERLWLPPDKRGPDRSFPPDTRAKIEQGLREQVARHRREKGWPPLGES